VKEDIKSILNITFDLDDFTNSAKIFITRDTKRKIKEAEQKLSEIQKQLADADTKEPQDVGEIYRLFMASAPAGMSTLKKSFDSISKIRKLARSLSYTENGENRNISIAQSDYLQPALEIVDQNFRPSMLLPIFIALMKNWLHPNSVYLRSYLKIRIKENYGKQVEQLRPKASFVTDPKGPEKLCRYVIDSGSSLDDAVKFFEYESMITYEYFSEVAKIFTRMILSHPNFQVFLDDIIAFLKKHQLRDTKKKCLEKIINHIHRTAGSEDMQMQLVNFCFEEIGDPGNESAWYPWQGANENDRANLEKARKILLRWLAGKFLYIFFEQITFDTDRQDYWRKYLDYVIDFKIYSSYSEKEKLRNKNRFSDVDPKVINSKIGILIDGGSTSAFVMKVKNNNIVYTIVEFSQTGGACYLYKDINEIAPKLSKQRVRRSHLGHEENREMAVKVINSAANLFEFQDEGRVFHSEGWQKKLDAWINRYLRIEIKDA